MNQEIRENTVDAATAAQLATQTEEVETQYFDEKCNDEELLELLQNAVLHPILKDATLNYLSDKANQYVKTLLPNKPQKAATGRQAKIVPSSKKKSRKILFASAQELYKKVKKKLLEVIEDDNLKKFTFSGNKTKEGRAEYLRKIMETHSVDNPPL